MKRPKAMKPEANDATIKGQYPEFEGWTFTAREALRVRKDYTLKDFREVNPNTKYSWLHMNEFMPSATIRRLGDISKLQYSLKPEIGKIKVTNAIDALTLEEYIKLSELQGIIIVYKGKIVYERYPRMCAFDKHLYFSVTKTFASACIAILEDDGKINVQDTIGKYLPELNKSDWAKVKVTDILNMASGMTAQYDDPGARTDSNNLYFQFESALGIQIKTSATEYDVWSALNKMHRIKAPGISFEYGGHNTIILTLLVERITGKPFAEFVSTRIWNKIGAEADAYFGLSPQGIAVSSAAMNSTLRDLARYGLLFTPSWKKVSKEKIISDAYLKKIQKRGGNTEIYDKGGFGKRMIKELGEKPTHNSYQWDLVMDDGDFFKAGINGQGLYISRAKDLVIACFSHGDYIPGVSVAYLSRAIAKSF
ncbi:MAG TPA: serine hydrolase domain-containing protein [Chitinophagaceae bacterium]|nr:serine hydrolase domain-containing protein [Chitinophagaceae bacterium]